MSVNQDCAEKMLINAAKRRLNITLEFNYPNPIKDVQLDISCAWITSPDEQKHYWNSGKHESTLLADLSKLDCDKTYFLRTGKNGAAGHYQMLYFDNAGQTWQSYSSDTNFYPITQADGTLTTLAKTSLLTQHANWGMANDQYSILVVDASEENIIRAANYIYDCRTHDPEYALAQAFTREPQFDKSLSVSKIQSLPSTTQSPMFFHPLNSSKLNSPLPFKEKSSTLSVHWTELVNKQIITLKQEINSCWPYPNKHRKQIKVDALQSLLKQCADGRSVSETIKAIKIAYPEALAGHLSRRTANLLEDIISDRRCYTYI